MSAGSSWLTERIAALIAVPGLMPALAHAQLVGEAAQPQPIDAPWGMQLAPQLEEHPLPEGQKAATFVLGDTTSGTTDQDMAAKGSAEVRRNTFVIKADALHYDQDTDMADAYGQVHLNNNGATFAGPEAHMRGDWRLGSASAKRAANPNGPPETVGPANAHLPEIRSRNPSN